MANIKYLQQQVSALNNKIGDLSQKIATASNSAAREREFAAKKVAAADKAKTSVSIQRLLSDARRYEDKAMTHGDKMGDLHKQLARAQSQLASKQAELRRAEDSHNKAIVRELTRRRRDEIAHARQLIRAALPHPEPVPLRPAAPKPSILKVAFFAASPAGEARLRVDRELREVHEAVRRSLHRDLLDIKPWTAATFDDIITALNEQQPQLVHFAGHGNKDGLAFDTPDEKSDFVEYDFLARALDATDTKPRVVVLNACHSYAGVQVLLEVVDVVVAMLDEVSDIAARAFSVKFYSAIASGQSLASALKQAQLIVERLTGEGTTPEMIARPGIDPATLKLVTPAPPEQGEAAVS